MTLIGQHLTSAELGAIADELDDLLLPYQMNLSIFQKLNPFENLKRKACARR